MVANRFLSLQIVSYGYKAFLMVANRLLWLHIVFNGYDIHLRLIF